MPKSKAEIRHQDAQTVIEAAKDTIPLSLWFWFAAAIFVICLIGTLLYVRDVATHDDDDASAKQPIEVKGL